MGDDSSYSEADMKQYIIVSINITPLGTKQLKPISSHKHMYGSLCWIALPSVSVFVEDNADGLSSGNLSWKTIMIYRYYQWIFWKSCQVQILAYAMLSDATLISF